VQRWNVLRSYQRQEELEAERAGVFRYEALQGERVTLEESPPSSGEEEFIPFESPTLDPERYTDVETTLPAPDATVIHDDATAALTDDPDEEMDDDTIASSPSISWMRSVGSVTSGSGLSVSDASRSLNRRSPEALNASQSFMSSSARGWPRNPNGIAAFAIWKEHVSNGRYDECPDHRIPVLTLACGLRNDLGVDTPAQQREWLYNNNFKHFVNNVNASPTQHDLSNTLEGIHERIKYVGGDMLLALAMAMFYFDPMTSRMSNDEIRWADFLWSDHDWRDLQRWELVMISNTIKVTKPWPHVREEVILHPSVGNPIRMTLDELDIGNRRLNMLIALYEHKYKAHFLKTQKAMAARGIYNAVGPLMLTIRDPGGFALDDLQKAIFPDTLGPSASLQDSGAGSSTLAQVPVVSVHADDNEDESTHSSDPGGLQEENRKEAREIEQEARLAQLDNKDASFNELASVTKKELADDKAAEERRIRGELGMVRPVDTDPDLKGDRIRSSNTTAADKVGSRLQQLSLWNEICMDHINVNTDWCIGNAPDSESVILIQPTLVDAHVIEVETYRKFVEAAYGEV
jgi:hypothetical protein